MRVLLVEDDAMVGAAVRQGLLLSGFAVDWVRDGAQADAAATSVAYDAVVLDLGLPQRDGMSLLAAWRGRGLQLPVLIASARDAVADRIAGLEAGADDYVLKPFDLDELVARLRAVLRRRGGQAQALLHAWGGQLVMDPARHEVTLSGKAVALSAREFAVLEVLMRRPGQAVARSRIEDSVYAWGDEVGSNAVEVHLHNLRRKLGADRIVNVRGVGYKVDA
jgi:two-component system, OmpR family, response regulator QseB